MAAITAGDGLYRHAVPRSQASAYQDRRRPAVGGAGHPDGPYRAGENDRCTGTATART